MKYAFISERFGIESRVLPVNIIFERGARWG